MKKLNYNLILILLFLASVFVLALNKIEDTDTWTHLVLGKLIWEFKGIPQKEQLLYTHFDQPFASNSWLFELVFYLAYYVFKLYGVVLLKAGIITASFYILLKDSLRPNRNTLVAVICMAAIVVVARHRFVERPDIFLMLFLSFNIFALNAFLYDNKRYIYILPLINLLWANSHPSIILMLVPFLAFIAGGTLQKFINKKRTIFHDTPSDRQLMVVAGIFVLSIAASFITPYSILSELQGGVRYVLANIMPASPAGQVSSGAASVVSSDWWSQEVSELRKPTWEIAKAPYLIVSLLVLSFVLNVRRLSLISIFMVIPFIHLSFTALRFIFLFAVVAGPVIIRNMSSFLSMPEIDRFLGRKAVIAVAAFWLVIYTGLSVANVSPFGNDDKEFGFGVNYDNIPEGALKYMDEKGIEGRVFNQFHWGGYMSWRDFPKRSAFIDGRGLLSPDLLEKTGKARSNELVLSELEKKYGFVSVLVEFQLMEEKTNEVITERDLGLAGNEWALVYWDDISLVYVKRGGKYDSVIRDDEYRFVKPANGEYSLRGKLQNKDSRDLIIAELKRNINKTHSSRAYALLGFVYNETGLYREAIEAYSKVKDHTLPFISQLSRAYNGMAFAYGKLGRLDDAISYYRKGLSMSADAISYYNLGLIYSQKGDRMSALDCMKSALEVNSMFVPAHEHIVALYNEMGMKDEANKAAKSYEAARVGSQGEEHFRAGTQAFFRGSFQAALVEFNKSIKINPGNPSPYSNAGYIYYDMGDYMRAFEYQKRALDIDPDFANAYYGMALVYKKWGDPVLARKNWEEYLRLEPAGYFSRRAKEEIAAMSRQ